jgi:transcriptional regulator with XRE-family HTH domain
MTSTDMDIGSRIRAYRKKTGLTLNQLAKTTGIAASNLSSIELNKSSPTLNTLVRIARAFDMSPGAFLDEALSQRVTFCTRDEGQLIDTRSSGVSLRRVTSHGAGHRMDCLSALLEPGANWTPSEGMLGERFIYCLDGEVRATAAGESRPLRSGDSVHLLPRTDISLENRRDSPASILIIISDREAGDT